MKSLGLLFAFLFSFVAYSQNSQLQNFSIEHGLPQSQVVDIEQDAIGYLWLATQGGGMVKFDGDEFEVFSEKNGLNNNFVNDITIINNQLLIATNSGLSIYKNHEFNSYQTEVTKKVLHLNNNTYLATQKGISLFRNDSLKQLKINYQIDFNPVNDIIYHNNYYWIANRFGLWKVDDLETPKSIIKITNTEVTSTVIYKNQLIIASFTEGILQLKNNQKLTPLNNNIKRIVNINTIKNQLYVSTDTHGLYILSTDFTVEKKIDQNSGLKVNHLKKSFLDHQDNIWLATSGGGIYKYTQNDFKHYSRLSGLKGNRVYAVNANKKNEIWASNSEKGLIYIDSLGVHYLNINNQFFNTKVKTITTDHYQRIWAGTDGKGIGVITKEEVALDSLFNTESESKNRFPVYSLDTISIKDGLASNWVKKIVSDSLTAWVVTYSSGISKVDIDPNTKEIRAVTNFNKKNGLGDLYVNDAVLDNEGKLWFATKNGSLGYIANNQIKYYHNILKNNVAINSLAISKNELFIGTLGKGVWKTSINNPENVNPLTGNKIPTSNYIYQLTFDLENNLWLGLRNGVNKIVLSSNNTIDDVFYFGKSDGFLGIETCSNAITLDSNGQIWFGTMNGLTKYVPSNTEKKLLKPFISFEELRVNNNSIDSITINNYYTPLELKPNENNISFQYKSIDLNHPKAIEYQWKLNDEVSNWSTNPQVDFANLSYGNYTIEVTSRNRDGLNSNPISFDFIIKTPWFKKASFIWSSSITGSLIFLLIILLYVRSVKKKNKQKLAQLAIKNHLLTLEQKALQLQMNPHFVFNVLNGIKALGNKGEIDQMNDTISSFSSLLRSVLQSSREEEISLDKEIDYLKNYLKLEQEMSSQSFDYEFSLDTNNISFDEILIPPMLIQPFVENAIKHGFKNIDRKGKVTISFTVKNEQLLCSILDNGIGFNNSKNKHKVGHQSVALKVTKDRLNTISLNHNFKITEVKKESKVCGTLVTFNIPLKTDF